MSQVIILVSKTLKEAAVSSEMGVTVLAIRRGDKLISNPSADEKLQIKDILIIYGEKDSSEAFKKDCRG